MKRKLVAGGRCTPVADDLLTQFDQIAGIASDLERTRFESGDVQEIVDQSGHAIDMTRDRVQPTDMRIVSAFFGQVFGDELHEPSNWCQWRAELVRYHRDE